MLLLKPLIYPWFIIKPLEITSSNKFAEILISRYILCKQDKMKRILMLTIFLASTHYGFIKSAVWGNICLASNNRFYAVSNSLFIKFNDPEHIPMVSHCKGRHSIFLCKAEKLIMPYCPVKKAILRMQMKMNKI